MLCIVSLVLSMLIGFCAMSFVPPDSKYHENFYKVSLGVSTTMVFVLIFISVTWSKIELYSDELYVAQDSLQNDFKAANECLDQYTRINTDNFNKVFLQLDDQIGTAKTTVIIVFVVGFAIPFFAGIFGYERVRKRHEHVDYDEEEDDNEIEKDKDLGEPLHDESLDDVNIQAIN